MLAPAVPGAATPVMSDADYRQFQDFFYRHTGIVFGAAKRAFVDRRLADRLATTGHASLRAYLLHLKFDATGPAELQALVDALTVNETYFYREEYQFRCLLRSILPEVVAGRPGSGRPIRIWSLPCSTGEEPYSIALQLIEGWPDLARHDVEVIGSDIDSHVLRRARAGRYDDRAVQHLPAPVLARHFEALPGRGGWQISEALRNAVDFRQVNLHDRGAMGRAAEEGFDVIFCRNLLIYFDDVSRSQAAQSLFDALRPGGFVCLGHSESMSRISSLFILRKFPDAIVYQRPRT
jgi:chemotaxis protein methyltransferase CheR